MANNKKKETKEEIGSRTAITGFINEDRIRNKFNDWNSDENAKDWLEYIAKNQGFQINEITDVVANKLGGKSKSDVLVKIFIKNKGYIEIGVSLKKQNEQGYNHIHREKPFDFAKRFSFPKEAETALLKYCGFEGYSPYDMYRNGKIPYETYLKYDDIPEKRKKKHREGTGRFYFDELISSEQEILLETFSRKVDEILIYILKTGKFDYYPADYVICTKRTQKDNFLFSIETIEEIILRARGTGKVDVDKKRKHPSIHMGLLTIQRKGGTAGASNISSYNSMALEILESNS